LIELMVVVLIIAILLAIAIPTFLGARTKAQDRAAQSDLRNALTAEKTFYVDGQAYTGSSSALNASERHLLRSGLGQRPAGHVPLDAAVRLPEHRLLANRPPAKSPASLSRLGRSA